MKAATIILAFVALLLVVVWLFKDLYTVRGAPVIGKHPIDMRKMT